MTQGTPTNLPDSAQIDRWLIGTEAEQLEFKAAANQFDFDKLLGYCAAIANEGGGYLVLGVTDKKPRKVCGTNAFRDLNDKKLALLNRLALRIDAHEVSHPNGRVVVFKIPSRPTGRPISLDGRNLMRVGESLVDMTPDQLEAIFAEATPDFSAELCTRAGIGDLDPRLISYFRSKWHERAGHAEMSRRQDEAQLLEDAELTVDGGITFAAIALLGTAKSVSKYLPQAELTFEYRSSVASIAAQQRLEFRQGFLGYIDELWDQINLRNEQQQLRQGMFVTMLPDLNEAVVREVLLNALAHRDYRSGGSIRVLQSPRRLQIISPGGLPAGITPQNIMFKQMPRNRRIAEALQKCGLVERGNQGAKRMFETNIKEGKGFPDFTGTDAYQVSVTLHGETAEPAFIAYLNKLGEQRLRSFEIADLLVLELVHRQLPVPDELKPSLQKLKTAGAIESSGHGRGTRYILSHNFYRDAGNLAEYTRAKGLGVDEKKALLLKHLHRCGSAGAPIRDLEKVVTNVPRTTLVRMLNEMREAGQIVMRGSKRWAHWLVREAADEIDKAS